MVNSRLDQSTAAGEGSGGRPLHPPRRPFSRSYGAILPSSLTMVLPIASVCSTHPPVSVCGTGPFGLPRGFSRQLGLTGFAVMASSGPSGFVAPAFHEEPPYGPSRGRPEPRPATLLRRPIGVSARRGCRNVDRLCIGYGCRPRLSSRLTLGGLASPRKPWVHGGLVSRQSLATHASILTSGRSTPGRPDASPRTESSPTDGRSGRPAASAPCLAPYIVGACPLDQ